MGTVKKRDFTDPEVVIKVLNGRKTTIDNILENLREMIQDFQLVKEDFYVDKLQKKLSKKHIEISEKDLEQYTSQIEANVEKDTKNFVDGYILKMNDVILDAINSKQLRKKPAHAFLVLLQAMEAAFKKESQ